METNKNEDERAWPTRGRLECGSLTAALSEVTQSLVKAALSGANDGDLARLFGSALIAVGLDISTIEVACDAVDPERAQHFIRWRRNVDAIESSISAQDVFQSMLEEGATVIRLNAASGEFAAIMQEGATDAIAFAIHLAPDVTVGFFDDVMSLFVTERPGGLSVAEIEFLTLAAPVFALALGARLNAAAASALLKTYLGRNAATALLSGRVGLGEVEQIRAVVIYCDLFGFTSLTETLDPRSLIESLNLFFETVIRPASRAGGQVSGHVGDAVVMFFRIPDPESEQSICAAAVTAAVEGLQALDLLNTTCRERLAPPLRARVGIDVGEVVHGNIGSAGRFSFTIIGAPVNRAARLQALAKDVGAVVLMTSALAEAAGVRCAAFGRHALRGFERPVDVVGLRASDDART
jgi:adenylate cyclase